MSDPATSKGAATRERIVAAAADLMHRHGAAGTTTPAVRASASVSSSQIYHYFSDKQALTEAVIGWWSDRIVEGQVALLSEVVDAEGLRRWGRSIVGAAQDHRGCPLGGLTDEVTDNPRARAASRAGYQRWQRAIGEALARLVETGVLAADTNVERHSSSLLAAIQGGLLIGKATQSTHALESALDCSLNALLAHQ